MRFNSRDELQRQCQLLEYFTPDWCSGEISDDAADAVSDNYQKHLARILPDLPPDARRLAAEVNIHDGLLWNVLADTAQNTLQLSLRCGDLQAGYFDCELHYLQVEFTPEALENLAGLASDPSQTDLSGDRYYSEALYDELDTAKDAFAHRILFRSHGHYQEIVVWFKQIRLCITPRADRLLRQN